MVSHKIHTFSESGLHTALLAALILLFVVSVVDAMFFTPEGSTPVLWRLDPVVITGQSQPSR
ncbi:MULTISPECIES: hypothetical protein [Roseateles]|uniref:Uncharacterized protein n=1 Tax=Roseateles albus TaxID=2987525 RepID=A0ABT5KKI2_9BURK|nr:MULTISPECIES: hypothetical protein [Roseateles]MCV2361099.1 hypothetical protein [Paucibacter sp. TC2R-5]MDC8773954.1 hypothetical protein [Roseateles albus]